MVRHMELARGGACRADDPKRGVWYAAEHDLCGYWTDDWDKLRSVMSGIPACPHCGCVGMQMPWSEWMGGAEKFSEDNPRYAEWLALCKEKCFGRTGKGWMATYHAWIAEQT